MAVQNCAKHEIGYIEVDGNEISEAIQLLSIHRKESQELSPQMIKVCSKLNTLAFTAIRSLVSFDEMTKELYCMALDDSKEVINSEKKYMSLQIYEDYLKAIDRLYQIYGNGIRLNKIDALKKWMAENKGQNIYLIAADQSDKNTITKYWEPIAKKNSCNLSVFYKDEYINKTVFLPGVTIIAGWFKSSIMRRILYSYHTFKYYVLLYNYEKKWRNFDSRLWKSAIKNDNNKKIVDKSFSTKKNYVSLPAPSYEKTEPVSEENEMDDLSAIESIISSNRIKQYSAGGKNTPISELTEVVPVSFVGDYLELYKMSHKVLNVTDAILGEADKISQIFPNELHVGDFVVEREAAHDLILEIADIILQKEGNEKSRETAGKWREVLKIETLFSTREQVYKKLCEHGCKVSYQAFMYWLEDDGCIAPKKENLEHIAAAMGESVLNESLDEIINAAAIVRTAHTKAGKVLSIGLKKKIVSSLSEYGTIDPFNIWKPISIDIEGIGTVRVLKIIDIGEVITVDSADTNRLIKEE
jgi:hypothetical protein